MGEAQVLPEVSKVDLLFHSSAGNSSLRDRASIAAASLSPGDQWSHGKEGHTVGSAGSTASPASGSGTAFHWSHWCAPAHVAARALKLQAVGNSASFANCHPA